MSNGENNNINKNGDSKKIVILIVLIATLMLGTTGATYAYFALTATNSSTITGTAATTSLELTVTQAALKSGNTGVMVPQKEAALATAMNSTNKCVDGNNNVICKVYTITVTNKTQSEDPKQEKSESDENKIPDKNTIDDQNSIDKVQSKDNNTVDPSKAKGSLPKAGLKNVMILAALIIVISGVFSFARYKMIKLK